MIAVEMIGTFSDAKGSQRYPTPVKKAIYPTKGNFVAVVGRGGHAESVREVAGALVAAGSVPVETIVAPASLEGIDFSDHLNFWAQGWPAVMVTDTAFMRNPRYHTPDDLPDTLDYPRMAEVVSGVHCAVQAAARR
jgi:Peptidase family M28